MKRLILLLTAVALICSVSPSYAVPVAPGFPPGEGSIYNAGSCTGAVTINYANASSQNLALGGACTISFTRPPSGYRTYVLLKITQNTGVHYNVTWSGVKWSAGLVPIVSVTDGAIDLVSCFLDSDGVYCMFSPDFH